MKHSNKDKYAPVLFPLIFMLSSLIIFAIVSGLLKLPKVIGQVYAILHLPFACYYWTRLLEIRNRNRAAGYMYLNNNKPSNDIEN